MTLRAQIIIGIILLIGLAAILNMVRKRSLELKYVLVWIVCDIVLLIIIIRPSLMDSIAKILGIQSPMNMIFFVGFLLSIVIIFSLTVALSRMNNRLRKLAQMMALKNDELENSGSSEKKQNKMSGSC
ncbi:hypothetical protein BRYFOR_07382 [Marvinbryantia formatexigens DSM 14469]|uniref:DUF2304 domain-containing protein n=1 Tax=Marvinbryantia formatexigens DSM 14469 TaxID=478749 RepID=C6LFH9_9FIRM|nr:DUF2304 domain-containing protein [Marvinbryantia formatexigens]EET60564.1 hypothetical protein BRYFOR_07382 [Marvinbryantia formatexigens DSM 14469]UWO25560.1 DUF2304 domain-containing protein [Marvinbryantia formatexigens DSM 14469]SDG19839.1 hypothetical protein SAMN05660368_02109 [Marvinbryantia formatexigens]